MTPSYTFDFAKLIRLRHDRCLTLEVLAKKVGVAPMAISRWENGKAVPRLKNIAALAKVLGVSRRELMKETEVTA